jgi:hypothetical protein
MELALRRERLRSFPFRVLLPDEIGLSLSRLPTLLGFCALTTTIIWLGRGPGVTSSRADVRHHRQSPYLWTV